MSQDETGNGGSGRARALGAAFLISALVSAGAATAQTSSTDDTDTSTTIEQTLRRNRANLEEARDRADATNRLGADLRGGATGSEATLSYRLRLQQAEKKKRTTTKPMFYQQQMDR